LGKTHHSVRTPTNTIPNIWKNTKSSAAVVKEKQKLQLFLQKRKTEIPVVQIVM
jgi:hypothetical protein